MEPSTLKIGDVVRLNSGGPRMTVIDLITGTGQPTVRVCFQEFSGGFMGAGGYCLHERDFPAAALELAGPAPTFSGMWGAGADLKIPSEVP